jgi:hypothetical protein
VARQGGSRDVARFASLRALRFLPLHLTGVAIASGVVLMTWLAQQAQVPTAPHRAAFSIALAVVIALLPWRRLKPLAGPLALATGGLLLTIAATGAEKSVGLTAIGRGLTGLGAGMTLFWLWTVLARRVPDRGRPRASLRGAGLDGAAPRHRRARHGPAPSSGRAA